MVSSEEDQVGGGRTGGLDVLLELGELLLELVEGDKLVLNDDSDLELLDPVSDGNELGESPEKAGLLDGADRGLEEGHVRLVVPGLDVEGDDRLGDGLGLGGLLAGGSSALVQRRGGRRTQHTRPIEPA